VIRKSHSWSSCATARKSTDHNGFLTSSSEGDQTPVAQVDNLLYRRLAVGRTKNHSRLLSRLTCHEKATSAPPFDFRFLFYAFNFSQAFRVLHGSVPVFGILTSFASEPVEITSFNIQSSSWIAPFHASPDSGISVSTFLPILFQLSIFCFQLFLPVSPHSSKRRKIFQERTH